MWGRMTKENCYHCNKEFEAGPDDCIGDTWICYKCGQELAKTGVIEDEYDGIRRFQRDDKED